MVCWCFQVCTPGQIVESRTDRILEDCHALGDLAWAVSRKQAVHVRASPKNTMATWDCTPDSIVEWRTERFNNVLRIVNLVRLRIGEFQEHVDINEGVSRGALAQDGYIK